MTALALDSARTAIPRRAIALSVAIHAAALFLLPGLARQATELDLPPLVATLRLLPPAAEPAAAAKAAEARPSPPQPLPRPPRTVEKTAAPVPHPTPVPALAPIAAAAPRSEAPPADSLPIPAPEKVAREESLPVPASAPAPAVPEHLVLDDYGRALSELLARQQQYPRLAALRGWEGEVRLRLRVARKGSLVAVQVVSSSGHEILDQHALALVQGAALPSPPDALGNREIQVVVPINYKLQRST